MNRLVAGLMDNDSTFGRIMTRCGTVIVLSLFFALCTVPIVTIGPAWTGVSRAFLRMYRGDGVINPFKEFWKGFKGEFRQSFIVGIVAIILGVLLYLEWFWCCQLGGFFLTFRYAFIVIAAILAIILVYIFPDIAAFNGTLKEHLQNSIYFAFSAPVNLGIIILAIAVPATLTYVFDAYLPLFGFLWIMCGFGMELQLICKLLVKEYAPHLPRVDKYGNILEDDEEDVSEEGFSQTDEEVLEEMKKLGM